MKIEIGSYGAKTKLPELLRQVKTGKSFTITNRGEAIAELVPMGQMGSHGQMHGQMGQMQMGQIGRANGVTGGQMGSGTNGVKGTNGVRSFNIALQVESR